MFTTHEPESLNYTDSYQGTSDLPLGANALLPRQNEAYEDEKEADFRNIWVMSDGIRSFTAYKIGKGIEVYGNPVVAFIGILTNIVSLSVLLRPRLRKHTSCTFMAAISVLDILILGYSLFFWLLGQLEVISFANWSCKLIYFLFYFTIHYNVALLVSMTAQKYLAVRFPLKMAAWSTTRRTVIVIITLGLAYAVLHMQNFWTRKMMYDAEQNDWFCIAGKASYNYYLIHVHPWLDSTLYSFIPLTSLAVLNICIIVQLRRATKSRVDMRGGSQSATGKAGSTHQTTKMLLSVSFAFLVLTSPIGISLIVDSVIKWEMPLKQSAERYMMRALFALLMYTNHAINFWLYCFTGQKFREEFKTMWCRFPGPKSDYSGSKVSVHGGNTKSMISHIESG